MIWPAKALAEVPISRPIRHNMPFMPLVQESKLDELSSEEEEEKPPHFVKALLVHP